MAKAKRKTTNFSNFRGLISSILIFVFAIIVLIIILDYGYHSAKLSIQFQNYPQAQLVYQDSAGWGANVQKTNIFFWTDNDIDDVRSYFEKNDLTFYPSEDDYGEWSIAVFFSQKSHEIVIDPTHWISHNTLCDIRAGKQCITVSIIDTSQADFWQTAIMSPSTFKYSEIPFEKPFSGTLIIYSFAHVDY